MRSRNRGAYGPGAIKTRISQAMPGADPDFGWPAENEKFLKQQAQRSAEARRAQEVSERETKRKVTEHAQQLLERDYGPQLDTMSRE